MSGGRFEYSQHRIHDIATDIQFFLDSEDAAQYPEEVLESIRDGVKILRLAYVYAQRIDWLLSGDDGPESFSKRLVEDLKHLTEQGRQKC